MPSPKVEPGLRRRLAFEAYDHLNSERYSDQDAIPVDEDTIAYVKSYVYERSRVSVTTEDIARWLGNPAKFSPFIDETAMERAMEWEWRVYDNLSFDEKLELFRRLANHPDPTGSGKDLELDKAIRRHTGKQATSTAGSTPPKYKRFMDGGERRIAQVNLGVAKAKARAQ